ncbi:outer membrane protein assembly factor BamE domain-containing protein [Azohydromonas caseinilytica]|uniref:Outer membrane protein assembly factor BamE n=1 Tax=Azohydromonas caseinilytica TaxID=2728836 RepID=A0A848F6W1_9BURK|nr:outer membrane protein assembly factor BamE [Azohydromonas caseinilytica]NML14010.1 outer membrane protein assembly factor BamE [Azohydromonas caseinilytica]
MKLAALAALGVLLAGCDERHIAKLEEGLSTEADVRREFGEPERVREESDGSRTLEYTRQPAGRQNYLITIGPDGRMSALRQVLAPRYFAQVQPGMTREQVRDLLGRPAKRTPYRLSQTEVWDWRYLDGQQEKIFSVTFDAQGLVQKTGSMDEHINDR